MDSIQQDIWSLAPDNGGSNNNNHLTSKDTEPRFDDFENIQQLDETDELLLLRMAEITTDQVQDQEPPPTPGLKAVVDKAKATDHITNNNIPTEQNKLPATPTLLMERPKSSGISLTDFSFAKPFQFGRKRSPAGNQQQQQKQDQPTICSDLQKGTGPEKEGKRTEREVVGQGESTWECPSAICLQYMLTFFLFFQGELHRQRGLPLNIINLDLNHNQLESIRAPKLKRDLRY